MTPAVHADIIKLVSAGVPLDRAARSSGFDPACVRKWIRWGKSGKGEPYDSFSHDVEWHKADAIARCAISVQKASKEDWRAGAWYLERVDPDNFGRKNSLKVEVRRGVQDLLELVEPRMSEEAFGELVHAIASIQGVDEEEAGSESTED